MEEKGYKGKIVSAKHIPDLRQDVRKHHEAKLLDPDFYEQYKSYFEFKPDVDFAEIKSLFDTQNISTQVLAASIRTPQSVADLFAVGCDIITMPGKILHAMFNHPLTDSGLKKFLEDWEKVPIS